LQAFWRINYHTKRYKDLRFYGEGVLLLHFKPLMNTTTSMI